MARKILLIGKARSNRAVERLLRLKGLKHLEDYFFYDDQESASDFGSAAELPVEEFQLAVLSPGFPLKTPWLQDCIHQRGLKVIGDFEFCKEYLDKELVIAVTGSFGKSTFVSRLHYALEKIGESSALLGNIGHPVADYFADLKEGKRRRARFLVCELSSYQLENFDFPVDFAAITALAPNHLDRYASLDEYYQSKWNLLDHTKEKLACNLQSPDLRGWTAKHPHPKIIGIDQDFENQFFELLSAQLKLNPLDATGFPGIAHRFHRVEVPPRSFVNNSKATNLASVLFSVEESRRQFGAKIKLRLLLGGKDKGHDWKALTDLKRDPNLEIWCFGEASEKARAATGAPKSFPDLKTCLLECKKEPEFQVLLLAPGGASQDEFSDFEKRGEFFEAFVKEHFS